MTFQDVSEVAFLMGGIIWVVYMTAWAVDANARIKSLEEDRESPPPPKEDE